MSSVHKKAIISVISDLVTDQRVHRSALTLVENGYEVTLVGRQLKRSLALKPRTYKTVRFRLLFEKGPLFYAEYNFRLFFYLMFHSAGWFVANDLDTLPANYLVSRLKKVRLLYDSHEYFTEVPELISRPAIRKIWLIIEKMIFPRLKNVITVNDSIAAIYTSRYHIPVGVVRNLPLYRNFSAQPEKRSDWNIPMNSKVFLFQGAGINMDRGAEEAIEAIQKVDRAILLFIGSGDVIDHLKKKVVALKMEQKVFFIPRQPMEELIRYTAMADFGLTLDKDTNPNYRYSLPNKLFDYIQAGLPVLATDLPEVRKIIDQYDIGVISPSADPETLASKMREMMINENQLVHWKKNLKLAASELCWENEKKKFIERFSDDG